MQKDITIIPKIKSIYFIGIDYERNQKSIDKPEHNYLRDRKSFNYVSNQGIPLRIVPRNLTLDLFLDPILLKRNERRTEVYNDIERMAKIFLRYTGEKTLRLSDPITVGSLILPDQFESKRVRIVTEKGKQGDSAYCVPDESSSTYAFHDFNRKAFYKELEKRLKGFENLD